jgi:NADH-quinone oxidoreductase subunit C/D
VEELLSQERVPRLRARFPDARVALKPDVLSIAVDLGQWRQVITFLRDQEGFFMFIDLCVLDAGEGDEKFQVVCHLLNLEEHLRVRVKASFTGQTTFPGLSDIFAAATWYQREAQDLMGVQFSDTTKHNRLFVSNESESPKLFERDRRVNWIEAAKREVYEVPVSDSLGPKVWIEVDGEEVTRAALAIGHRHSGFEKECQRNSFEDIANQIAKLNPGAPCLLNVAWCRALEQVTGIIPPERAQALRMVLMELSRVSDHLLYLAESTQLAGVLSSFDECVVNSTLIESALQSFAGEKKIEEMVCIGGIAGDVPVGWVSSCLEVLARLEKGLARIDRPLSYSRFWRERLSVSPLSVQDAIRWGVTGPMLRACGVNYDLRKTAPFYFYDEVEFEIPLGINGDGFDRYLVRVEEIRQSLRIIAQVLDNLPVGQIRSEDERLRQRLAPVPSEYYSALESSNGEFGLYIVCSGKESPTRVKVRSPGFAHLQIFPQMLSGSMLAEVPMALASLHTVATEVDR